MMITLEKPQALYLQIASYFEKEIFEGRLKADDRIPPTSELVKQFKVSTDTIQQSLKYLASRGLIERTSKRGTFVRKGFGNRTVGIVFNKYIFTDSNTAFFRLLAERLGVYFKAKGWNSKIFACSSSGYDPCFFELKAAVNSGDIRTVVEFCAGDAVKAWLENECKVPYPRVSSQVDFNYFIEAGLEYLAGRNFKRIALVMNEPDEFSDYEGTISEFCRNHSFPENDIRIINCEPTREAGYEAVKNIYDSGFLPDSIVVGNDTAFKGALYRLLETGVKIPEKTGVVAYSNKGIDIFSHIPLTKLEVNPDDFVANIYDELTAAIEGHPFEPKLVKPKLVIGKSCGE